MKQTRHPKSLTWFVGLLLTAFIIAVIGWQVIMRWQETPQVRSAHSEVPAGTSTTGASGPSSISAFEQAADTASSTWGTNTNWNGSVACDIPKLSSVHIDGSDADWMSNGFRLDILATEDGRVVSATDFDPTCRLAWSDEGLLLFVKVKDDQASESPDKSRLYEGDSIELVTAQDSPSGFIGGRTLVIAPGLDPSHPEIRYKMSGATLDKLGSSSSTTAVQVARDVKTDGYNLEVLVPWQLLGAEGKVGVELRFQLYAFDRDRNSAGRLATVWYPSEETFRFYERTHRIRLATSSSPPVVLRAEGYYDADLKAAGIRIVGAPQILGKTVTIKAGDSFVVPRGTVFNGDLIPMEDGRASIDFYPLPMPQAVRGRGKFDILIDDSPQAAVILPSPNVYRLKTLQQLEWTFNSVFIGSAFPVGDWEDHAIAEAAYGRHNVSFTYFDDENRRVSLATKPGRYRAIAEIQGVSGAKAKRCYTLYRLPDELASWINVGGLKDHGADDARTQFLSSVGMRRAGGSNVSWDWLSKDDWYKNPEAAPLVAAAIGGTPTVLPTSATFTPNSTSVPDYRIQDRQGWINLRRSVYGFDNRFPKDIVAAPKPTAAPFPTLREGLPQEAGMQPEVVQKLDELLQRAVSEFPAEPVTVCLAHNGVVFFEKAYGTLKDGKPATTQMVGDLTSLTKTLSATLIMRFVEQGILDLDRPIVDYSPVLNKVSATRKLTLRHLLTHTSGIPAQWDPQRHQVEEEANDILPYIFPGSFEYSGGNYYLAASIIEDIAAKPLEQLYRDYLFEPLGLRNAVATNPSGDGQMTSRDLATFGQMLLNGGSYGNIEIFKPKTWQRMLPVDGWGPRGGAGIMYMGGQGLPNSTFGYSTGNSGIFRVVPEQALVIAVLSQGYPQRGLREKYEANFFAIIEDALQKFP